MRHLSGTVVLVVAAIAVAVMPVASQAPPAQKPSFEVATVKPNASGDIRTLILGQPGGRFTVTNATLKMVMAAAYRVRDFQISGGPNWVATDRWNIEGKAEEGSIPQLTGPPDQTVPNPLMLMVQSLIEDRFQLKMHRETKDMPVYELVIEKAGSKMKLSEDQTLPPLPQPGVPLTRGLMRVGRGSLGDNGIFFRNLVQVLSQQLGRTIIDKTDLKGLYDIKLKWTPELGQGPVALGGADAPPPPDTSAPSIFTALQEQLGLKLESAKGPVEVLVIDSVQKPSEN
jgi:uncharacterized protein (TIGR03435 family)